MNAMDAAIKRRGPQSVEHRRSISKGMKASWVRMSDEEKLARLSKSFGITELKPPARPKPKPCACGCGAMVEGRFRRGHNARGRKQTEEWKRKRLDAMVATRAAKKAMRATSDAQLDGAEMVTGGP